MNGPYHNQILRLSELLSSPSTSFLPHPTPSPLSPHPPHPLTPLPLPLFPFSSYVPQGVISFQGYTNCGTRSDTDKAMTPRYYGTPGDEQYTDLVR